jgi:hypothetical protein
MYILHDTTFSIDFKTEVVQFKNCVGLVKVKMVNTCRARTLIMYCIEKNTKLCNAC